MGLLGRLFGSDDTPRPVPVVQPGDDPQLHAYPAGPTDQDVVTAFSPARIMEILDEDGDRYEIDDDGDLFGRWDNDIFHFIFYMDEDRAALQISGRTMDPVAAEHTDELEVFLEDWNRTHHWPKSLTRELSDGLYPYGEITFDYTQGATQAQLRQHIMCAMATTSQMLQAARDHLGIEEPED